MRSLTYREACAKAREAGATDADIAREVSAVHAGSYGPRRMVSAMVFALQLHPWRNGAREWARLAGALSRKPITRKAA
jgi:hypothetical protein